MVAVGWIAVGLVGLIVADEYRNEEFGRSWFFACLGMGALFLLAMIASSLVSIRRYFDWHEQIERHRFEEEYPNAKEQVEARRKRQAAEDVRKRDERLAKTAVLQAEKAEAERKAKVAKSVVPQLVPELPTNFRPTTKNPALDFSAIDEVAVPKKRKEA